METYEQELETFRQQWNLPTYDLNRVAESVQALRFADSFLSGASSDNSPTTQYKKWFSRTLSIYFEANTVPNEDGQYMSSFDAQAFYNSFKTLVQAKYDADAEERNETPLKVEDVTNGQKQSLENIIAHCKRNYKKTLPTLWQENLKDGSLKLDTLRTITDNSYTAFRNRLDYEEDELDAKLTNLIAAREAMKQLRASRSGVLGWLWKVIFNRSQNRQEKAYLQDLNNKISALSGSYDIEAKVAALTGKTVLGKTLVEEKAKEKPAKAQEKPAKKPSKTVKVKPCAEKIEEMVNGDDYTENIVNNLMSKISFMGDKNYTQRMLDSMVIKPAFEDHINELNEQFDQDIKKGNQNEAVAKLVRGVFKVADEYYAYIVGNSNLNRVQACGILAKTLIDNLTAVAVYPELSSLANEYIGKNVSIYKEISDSDLFYDTEIDNYALDQNPTVNYTLEEIMKGEQSQDKKIDNVNNDASSAYDDLDDYEPAFDEDNPFVENASEIAPQVAQAPKQNVPTLNNGNK